MAIACSAEFKALWLQKQGRADYQRLAYKRRFKAGGVWQNEAEWGYLERPDFIGIGEIPQQVDLDGQNIVKVSSVNLRLANTQNEWRETLAGPSFWKATDAMPEGARAYKTIWAVQEGIRLNSTGEIEWITVFTGLGLRPKITGAGAEAQIEVRSYALLLEKADAEAVSEEPGLENCIPPTGDGSRTDFESTSTGVDHAKLLTVDDASSPPVPIEQLQGSGYRVSNDNEVASAGNTGRLLLTLASAPAAGRAIKTSVLRWLQNKKIEDLLGRLADAAGITSGMRTIVPVTFPGGVSGSKTVDSEAEWEAAAVIANAATVVAPGSAQRKWFLIDDFRDGDFTANPVWTVHRSDGAFPAVSGGALALQRAFGTGCRVSTPWARTTGTLSIRFSQGKNTILANVNRWYFMADAGAAVANGYFIEWGDDGSASVGKVLAGVESTLVTFTAWTGTVGSDTATWRVTRSADGSIDVYKDGVLLVSASDSDLNSSSVMVFDCKNAIGTTTLDDVYWSPELDGVGATSTADTELVFIFDLLSAPTAMGLLEVLEDLNGGTTLIKTAGADDSGSSPPSPGTFDPLVERVAGVMQHTPKRWLKIYLKIIPSGFDSPIVHRLIARFITSDVFVSLANHRGKKVVDQVEEYVKLAGYELRFKGDGTLYVGPKDQESAPVVELDQENGVIDVGDEDTGIPDRVVRAGRVRYQGFVSFYGDDEAGASADVKADGEELGSDAEDQDLGDILVANDLAIGDARARLTYEQGRRSATDPRPRRRLPADIWDVPWLEVSDRLRFTFTDHPRLLAFQANDELVKVDDYLHAGAPDSVLVNALDFKVLYYNPNKDTGRAKVLLEEIPA